MRLALLIFLLVLTASAQIPPRIMQDMLRAVPVAGFTMPTGLELQFESSSFAVSHGTIVTNWPELIHGWNATNVTVTENYVTNNWFGGQPAVRMDNAASTTNKILMLPASSLGILRNVAGATVLSVSKGDYFTTGTYKPILHFSTGYTAGSARVLLGMSTSTSPGGQVGRARRLTNNETGVDAVAGSGSGTNAVLLTALRIDFTNGKMEMWTNGMACTTNNLTSSGNTDDTDSLLVAIGGNGSDNPWRGWLGAILVWPRYLSDVERASVESYLKTKYSTP